MGAGHEGVRGVGCNLALKSEKLILKIGGMSCASCPQTIEKAVIPYDPMQITPETIVENSDNLLNY